MFFFLFYFGSQRLPNDLTVSNDDDGVYIPYNSNFPAIDMIWKTGTYIFGVQIHTSRTHSDVADQFERLCNSAGWSKKFGSSVFLIYLCPDETCMMINQPSVTKSGRVKIGYITIKQVNCLENLQL